MQDIRKIPVADISADKDQPRKLFAEAETRALGQNMLTIGQQISLIVYEDEGKYTLADGERRWRAASLVGIAELDAIVLAHKPDAAALKIIQASIEAHKVSLTVWERSCFLRRIKDENGWSISELAAQLHMKQPLVSKLLACQRLDKAIQQLLHTGGLDLEKAFIVSQEPSIERQREMVKLYSQLPRDQFRQKTRPAATGEQATVKRARFYLRGGASVIVHAPALTLADAIGCLLETVRQLKRVQSQNQDIGSAQKLLKSKARTNHVVVEENQPTR